jgi:hypothetical protein
LSPAVRAGTLTDYGATTLALVGISIPNFWLGPLMAIVFSISLGWLPVSGRGSAAHLILPAITLGAPLAAVPGAHDACERYRGTERTLTSLPRERVVSRGSAPSSVTRFATA